MRLSHYEQRSEYPHAPIAEEEKPTGCENSQDVLIVSGKRRLQVSTSAPRLSQTPQRRAEMEPSSLRVSVPFPPCWVNPTWSDPSAAPAALLVCPAGMHRHLNGSAQPVLGQKRVPESQHRVRSSARLPRLCYRAQHGNNLGPTQQPTNEKQA